MNLIRLLILVAVVVIAYRLIKGALVSHGKTRAVRKPSAEVAMERCAYCGMHVPEKEAVHKDGRSYCCPEHRDADHG